jgi:hypothetical protein
MLNIKSEFLVTLYSVILKRISQNIVHINTSTLCFYFCPWLTLHKTHNYFTYFKHLVSNVTIQTNV